MHKILLVEDSDIDRVIAVRLLQKESGFEVTSVPNGRRALEEIRKNPPDIVVTDLQMPEMNGLQLVECVRKEFPSLPVVLMTYRGSENIAGEALRLGAASYVPKQCLAEKLRETVKRIVASIESRRGRSRLMRSMERTSSLFHLKSDPELIEPLVDHVHDLLGCGSFQNEVELLRLGLVLKHALWIGHYHGNLEIPLDLQMTDEGFQKLAADRILQSPYNSRTLHVGIDITTTEAVFTIGFEGPPLDVPLVTRLQTESIGGLTWSSGFVYMASVADDVRYDDTAIRVLCRMAKKEDGESPQSCLMCT